MHTRWRLSLIAVVVVVVAALSSPLWPALVGGSTSYVTTYGNSMEPMFQAGDLAVVRPASAYDVGDVVAYRSALLDTVVLHRIVEREGDLFTFQGDNNDFLDLDQLGADQLLGRLALRVPQGGKALTWLSEPVHAAILAIGATVLPALLATRRRRRDDDPDSTRGVTMTPTTTAGLRNATSWAAIAGVGLLAVGGFALSQPTTQLVDEDVSFTHRGRLSYSAPAAPPLFPDGVTTGDPVFTRLADRVAITFTHGIDADGPVALDGTVAVDALLTGSGGWTRTVNLGDPQPVADGGTEVDVELDLPALRALAAEAATITGAPAGQLQLTVVPWVDVVGTVAGQVVEERFEPTFAFTLDDVALRPSAPAATGTGDPGTGDGEDERGGFTVEQVGTVAVPTEQVALLPLPLPGPDVTVAVARTAGPIGATLLLVAGLLALSARPKGDEAARIAARHGRLLVPIRNAGGAQHRAVIELATIDDLVRVAEHHERLVLHHVAEGQHTYLVEVSGTAYRYTATAARPTDVTNLHERRRRPRHAGRTTKRQAIMPETLVQDGAFVEAAGGAESSWASDALREVAR